MPYFEVRPLVVVLQHYVRRVRVEVTEGHIPADCLDGQFVYNWMGLDLNENGEDGTDIARNDDVERLARKLIGEVHDYARARLREVAAAGLVIPSSQFTDLVRVNRDLIKDRVHFKVLDLKE